jgi:hypothetical protein
MYNSYDANFDTQVAHFDGVSLFIDAQLEQFANPKCYDCKDPGIDYRWFYVPLKNISLLWRRHHFWWRTAKFWPMLGAQDLWAGRDLYRVTPAVTRDLVFSCLIRRTVPFIRLLRHTRRIYSNPDPHGEKIRGEIRNKSPFFLLLYRCLVICGLADTHVHI